MRKVSLVIICFILLTGISWAQYYPKARQVATNTTNFDGVLSGTDTDVQKALETIDAISLAGTGNVTAEGFVAEQVLFGSSATGAKGDAQFTYNSTTDILKLVVFAPASNVLYTNLTAAADQWLVSQTNTAGTEWVSGNPTGLIWINDKRTGTTVNEKEEASLVVTGDGTYSAYFEDQTYFGNAINAYAGLLMRADDNVAYTSIGADIDIVWAYDLNGAGDDFLSWAIRRQAASDSAAIYLFTDYTNNNPSGDTGHDNYISPTFVLLNSNGADKGDYSAVVMGERTQSDVATTHYFDFYAMTGASDGGVNATTTEIAPMFRIGDSGTATSGHSLSSGDVLFEDDVEINGMLWADGGVTGALTGNADTATALAGGLDNLIALTSNTTGNYVASVATTAPITGGAAGSEGATLTIVIPKATTSVDGYLNSTDWTTFNGKMAGTLLKDLVTTAPLTGAENDIFPGADADVTLAITMTGDIVATAPVLINGTTSVDNILPGNDVDTTISINMLGDLATTSPITGAVNDIFPGATGAKATIAFDNGALALKNQTKSISIYNITASHDVLLWQTPKAITITNVSMACTGGTDVVAVLQECNVTGQTCVNLNTTFWQTLAGQGTSVDDFNDAAIAANAWLALNTTTVNGTPSNWGMTVKFDEN